MNGSHKIVALTATGLFTFATSAVTADTITVCASGCQYTSINAAIDAAEHGDVIQLSAETYTEGVVIDTDGKAITLRGTTDKNGDPTSILDGGDAHRVLVCENGEGADTVLEDLVVQRGWVSGGGSFGGGMYISNTSPTLRRCVFQSNRASSFAGALYAEYSDSHLVDCRFSSNSALNTGAIYWWVGSATLETCVFESNTGAYGAGIYIDESDMTLDGCEFTGNVAGYETFGGAGGAVYLCCNATPTFRDCLFSGNQALQDEGEGGAVFCEGSTPTFERCTFTGNSAGGEGGGAIHNDEGSATLIDCELSQNTAEDGGGGLHNEDDSTTAGSGLLLCGNTPVNIFVDSTSSQEAVVFCDSTLADCGDCSDADNDGVPDSSDVCPGGNDLVDSDGDQVPDDCDDCPDDPLKTEPGDCGCGVVDTGVHGDLDCDGDYDEDDIRSGMAAFGIIEGTPGDMDGDDDVDAADFALLRDQIGVEALGCVVADINGDGEVDGADFAYILGYWGVCSAP